MDLNTFFQHPSIKVTLKLALICILSFMLLIPQMLILNLIDERQSLNQSVINEVAMGWAKDQLVTGPVLVIPYQLHENKNNKDVTSGGNLIIFPELLDIQGGLITQTKYRSLYKVLLYSTQLRVQGKFIIPDTRETLLNDAVLNYTEAYMAFGVSDLKGIQNELSATWLGDTLRVTPGLQDISFRYAMQSGIQNDIYHTDREQGGQDVKSGLSSKVTIQLGKKEYNFAYNMDLKGSRLLLFSPIARNTKVHIKSAFTDPSYVGDFLPNHTTNDQGFDAQWNVLEYNKILPTMQKNSNVIDMGSNVFGVRIVDAVDNYTKTYRAGKYMILIVILTFLSVFMTETARKLRIHIFQYILIGIAIAIFFILLLSISEFLGFNVAFIIAALATIGIIFLYSLGMFHNRKSSLILTALLTGLFIYIFVIIQLEKTALLVGSLGLFLILAAIMYISTNIKWYETEVK